MITGLWVAGCALMIKEYFVKMEIWQRVREGVGRRIWKEGKRKYTDQILSRPLSVDCRNLFSSNQNNLKF